MTAPNLEEIFRLAEAGLAGHKVYQSRIGTMSAGLKKRALWANLRPKFEAEVFTQVWPDTSCGLSDDPGGFAGQAMTEAYTTVVHETTTDMYVVFFDNQPAYIVHDPSWEFLEDLRHHSLLGKYEAKKTY